MSERCPTPGELVSYADAVSRGEEVPAVAEHIGGCPRCARRAAELVEVISLLRRAAPAASEPRECPHGRLLGAYADGSLSSRAAARFESHLARCPSCLAELADLWSIAGDADRDVPDAVVARVLDALRRDTSSAVVRWTERSLALVRDFAGGLGAIGGGLKPAYARGGEAAHLLWIAGRVSLDCEVSLIGGTPALSGSVSVDGAPGVGISVALRTARVVRGPESSDAGGRFGPWPLDAGANTLVLSGSDVPGLRAELSIEIVTEDRTGDRPPE